MTSRTVKLERPQDDKRPPVSPTAPTFVTLNEQLNKAHRRIRELEARVTDLLAYNQTLRAAITALTRDDQPRTAAALTSSSNDASDGFRIGDDRVKHTYPCPGSR